MTLIRPAVPNDADGIARVHIDSWLSTYRGLMPDAVLDNLSFERRRNWWQDIVNRSQKVDVMVADDDGQVAGFAYFGAECENDPVYHGELYAIYLLKDYQQKGLGRLLFKAAANGLLTCGLNNMIVWVLSANPARRFYEKLGGVYLRDKPEQFGEVTLQESAYGWGDIHPLAEMK